MTTSTPPIDDLSDEIESTPGYGPCVHCSDGGACLPGGCGVPGCERCGKACPYCKGTCEVPLPQVDDLSDIELAAEAAKQVRNLSELAEFGQRGTASLNSFGHTRLHRLLFDLLPFIALANPARLLALVIELRGLRTALQVERMAKTMASVVWDEGARAGLDALNPYLETK